MISYTSGDLLQADVEALVNAVNCAGVMGKGIALQFKRAFPRNFAIYKAACEAGDLIPGKILTVPTALELNPKYILNFPTKKHWRGSSKLEFIESGLAALIEEIRSYEIRSVALPPLGCGYGGLEWNVVRSLLESALVALPEVGIYIFEPTQAGRTK